MPITIMTGDMKYRDSLGNYHGLEGIRGETGPQGPKGDKGNTGDPAPASEVVPAVEDWLEENIVQETGYVLDRSLLANNAAAPANLVGNLKNAITSYETDVVGRTNLIEGVTYTTGKVIVADGTISNNANGKYTSLISVKKGSYELSYSKTGTGTVNIRIHAYNSSGTWLKQIDVLETIVEQDYVKNFEVDGETAYIRISCTNVVTLTKLLFYGKVADELEDISGLVNKAVKIVYTDKVEAETLYTRDDLTSGYIKTNGTSGSSSSTGYTSPFDVQAGEIISVNKYYIDGGVMTGETSGVFGTVVWFFDAEHTYTSKGYDWNASLSSVKVPDGVVAAQVTITSIMSGTYTRAVIKRVKPNGNKKFVVQERKVGDPLRFSGSLASTDVISLGFENSWTNKIWVFDGIIDTFGTVKIGSLNASNQIVRPYIEVTSSNVNVYSGVDSQFDKTFEHGLTIENDLQIIVEQGRTLYNKKLIVQSNGQRWVCSDTSMRVGEPYNGIGAVTAGSFTDCSVSVCAKDINHPTWVFGDSWVSLYDSRWVGQAVSLGYDKFLLSGHAGEGSQDALRSLKTLMAIKQPRTIVWAMGMNDEDTNDSTPNANWLSAVTEVMSICNDYNITLILCTIPSVPSSQGDYSGTSRNNNAKNAYVVASGYRYVDQVAAVGADTSGNWFSGYWQSNSDHAHPSELGARSLMARFFADAPELLES